MNWNDKTIKTYDDSAKALAAYFKGIGPRVEDIKLGRELAGMPNGEGNAVEIGCGDGRDATEIIKEFAKYEGFDPSNGLLTIARQKLPHTSFVVADALTYHYPLSVDVIYAFASLLHVNKKDFSTVLQNASKSLRQGGIFFISLKEKPKYLEEAKSDEYGERMFYYYNPVIVKEMSQGLFEAVYEDHQVIGKTEWFTIALKKI